ncbi:hypothetical protein [Sulfitobacter aestuariivivens]|uniref:Lipoprotein n=1 Tax=Sulfitobacter aestuariivivens TaxID=2766981 RepID=A0A927HG91_9RHOB|nr:hypothetical protein [Sulfitobacter aestuariivivens]MBD3664015.1 hypothetical protein [Sulfitobacter aestuariivivens]
MPPLSSRNRVTALLCGALLMSACASDSTKYEVRKGPQAIHPATLAPGYSPCGTPGQAACIPSQPGDGSVPIID